MLNLVYACVSILLILVSSEILLRKKIVGGETARKFVHILAGSVIAFLPFYISYQWIVLLGVGFVVINLINRYTSIFNAIHTINRKSYGDLFFGMAVIFCALLELPNWIFAAAILQVSISDGLAALIGSHFGKNPYKVLGHNKTLLGSWVFAISSMAIVIVAGQFGGLSNFYNINALILLAPLVLTGVENISGYGLDNLTIPMATVVLFSLFRF